MDESVSSLSDVRIASLITTSITDMVRLEVGKIMQELNMPVCNEAIDRIIAENLDKEVEKQNVVKTYKRKLNKVDQYKCIDKCAESDEVVISSIQLIENRVRKLEDFVVQNLMQRPQLMQELAVRSRENLMLVNEQQKTIDACEKSKANNNSDGPLNQLKSSQNKNCTLLNLDDVIKVIKECPETKDSFDIFKSAAEHIKHDLERFIQNYYKSDLPEREVHKRGSGDTEREKIACNNKCAESKDPDKPNEASKNMTFIKVAIESRDLVESTDSGTIVATGFNEAIQITERGAVDGTKAELEIVRPTVDEITNVALEAATNFKTEQKHERIETEIKKCTGGNAQSSIAQSMSCGDKRLDDVADPKLIRTAATATQEEKKSKTLQSSKLEKEHRRCKCQCAERRYFMRDRGKSCTIDEDIKWKLDKILDHIGDFCSRSKSGKESTTDSDARSFPINLQPGTSADFTRKRSSPTGLMKQKPKQLQQPFIRSCAYNNKCERKNIDRYMDQIRQMSHNIMPQKPEIVVVNSMGVPIKPKTNSNASGSPCALQNEIKPSPKPIEVPRNSVEAFKTKWSMEYSKNSMAKAAAMAKHHHHGKCAPKSASNPIRTNIEGIPKAAMKKRPNERAMATAKSAPHYQHQQLQDIEQKSSTTLMLESIDQLARTTAATRARIARVSQMQDEVGWVYSRRPPPLSQAPLPLSQVPPPVNKNEVRKTKVLYHNFKL